LWSRLLCHHSLLAAARAHTQLSLTTRETGCRKGAAKIALGRVLSDTWRCFEQVRGQLRSTASVRDRGSDQPAAWHHLSPVELNKSDPTGGRPGGGVGWGLYLGVRGRLRGPYCLRRACSVAVKTETGRVSCPVSVVSLNLVPCTPLLLPHYKTKLRPPLGSPPAATNCGWALLGTSNKSTQR
jgi:hypothetical protein